MSCLLYPAELHCSGGHGCVVRGYTQQQRCSVPVWFEPQPLAHTLTRTSVMTNAGFALVKILMDGGRRTNFRLPVSCDRSHPRIPRYTLEQELHLVGEDLAVA